MLEISIKHVRCTLWRSSTTLLFTNSEKQGFKYNFSLSTVNSMTKANRQQIQQSPVL
jgi:hypothetical protein